MTSGLIDFTSERERHEQLLGRDDVVAELDRLLRGSESVTRGWVLVKGGPGMGKSALLAHYLSRLEKSEGHPVPHHFLRRGELASDRPEVVRESLAAQVEALFPSCTVPEASPDSRLLQVLQRVSREELKPHQKRLLLVIDGLDEAEAEGEDGNPLERFLPHTLPPGVWVLCASRHMEPHLDWLETRDRFQCIDLGERRWRTSNEAAVRTYWERVAPDFTPPLEPGFVAELVQRSEGNMLYTVRMADRLRTQPAQSRRAELLPRGLKAFLEEMWREVQARSGEHWTVVRQGLGLVAAAYEALPLSELKSLARWKAPRLEEQFLRVARSFLSEERTEEVHEQAWRPFHESFRSFILSKLGEKDVRAIRHRLAKRFGAWPVKGKANDFRRRYALRHAVAHQVLVRDWEWVHALCTNLDYLEEKCQERAGVAALEQDLLRAAEAAGAKDHQTSSLRDLHRAVQAESHWLRKEPAALERLLYNRLLCMGWSRERLEKELHFSEGLPAFRLRHPVRMGAGEVRTLMGHEVWVVACALTPDMRLALSASHDHSLKLWELQGGRELDTLTGHEGPVNACTLWPDGSRALSASHDRTLKLWDLRARKELATLTGHTAALRACATTRDGRLALSASDDRTLKLWDLEAQCELATLTGHTAEVRACALTPDGRLALSASKDQTLKLWDVKSRRELATLQGHTAGVRACAITPDGRLALSASDDQTLKLWDLKARKVLTTLKGHTAAVRACSLSPDGRLALSASNDRTLKLWDLKTRRERATLKGHEAWVGACVLTPEGNHALSASDDRTLKLWDLQSRRELTALMGHDAWVRACALTPDGRRVLSASDDRTLKLWDLQSGRELRTLTGHEAAVRDCVLTADGKRALSASKDQTLKLWDLESGRELRTLKGHADMVRACALAPDGQQALSASDDQTLKLWDLQSGAELRTLEGHEQGVGACAFTPDGHRALSASDDHTLKLWDLKAVRELNTLSGHSEVVKDCMPMPGGQRALSASKDGTLKLWDLPSGQVHKTLEGHTEGVKACTLTPEGQALSASSDRTLRLWDLESGQCLQTILGCSSFTAVAATRDVICAGDGLGNIWVLETSAGRTSSESKSPDSPLFAWLHLSDIHADHGDEEHHWDQMLVLDALHKDLAEQRQRGLPVPDAILVTGDIAFSGIAPQYEKAKDWLRRLAEVAGTDPRYVFTVPGNHDVERAADNDRDLRRLVRSLREEEEKLDEALADDGDRAQLARRMQHYLAFAADFAPACLREPAPADQRLTWWLHHMEGREGLRVRLVGLNTALLSASEPDRGRLRLGKEALFRAFVDSPVKEGELVLALSHHPLLDGWLADQHEAEGWVRRHAHVHLSGHVHEAGSEEARAGSGGDFLRIQAGAVHEEHQSGVPARHGYNLAAVYAGDDGTLRLRVWHRMWSAKNKDFRSDVHSTSKDRDYAEHALSRVILPKQ